MGKKLKTCADKETSNHKKIQGNIIFPTVQLTTSRIGNLTRLIQTLLYVMTIHTNRVKIPASKDL